MALQLHPDQLQILHQNLQLFTLLLKTLHVLQIVLMFRHQVIEGSCKILLLHNTNLLVQNEARIEPSTLRNAIFDLAQDP